MDWLVNNWLLVVGGLAVVVGIIIGIAMRGRTSDATSGVPSNTAVPHPHPDPVVPVAREPDFQATTDLSSALAQHDDEDEDDSTKFFAPNPEASVSAKPDVDTMDLDFDLTGGDEAVGKVDLDLTAEEGSPSVDTLDFDLTADEGDPDKKA